MQKLTVKDADIMTIALQQEILRSAEARYDHRLHGVMLVSHGLTCYEVAEYLGQSPVTVQRWVQQFNTHGFAGLEDHERSGRPSRLPAEQLTILNRDLRRKPCEWGYKQNLWDSKLMAHHLMHSYGVQLGVRQCQRLFHQLKFRRRKPRPLIAKADPVAQDAYKKTSALGSRRSD